MEREKKSVEIKEKMRTDKIYNTPPLLMSYFQEGDQICNMDVIDNFPKTRERYYNLKMLRIVGVFELKKEKDYNTSQEEVFELLQMKYGIHIIFVINTWSSAWLSRAETFLNRFIKFTTYANCKTV